MTSIVWNGHVENSKTYQYFEIESKKFKGSIVTVVRNKKGKWTVSVNDKIVAEKLESLRIAIDLAERWYVK